MPNEPQPVACSNSEVVGRLIQGVLRAEQAAFAETEYELDPRLAGDTFDRANRRFKTKLAVTRNRLSRLDAPKPLCERFDQYASAFEVYSGSGIYDDTTDALDALEMAREELEAETLVLVQAADAPEHQAMQQEGGPKAIPNTNNPAGTPTNVPQKKSAPDSCGEQKTTNGPEGPQKGHRKRGAPRTSDPKEDQALRDDWKASGLSQSEFARERNLPLDEVTKACDRVKAAERRQRTNTPV